MQSFIRTVLGHEVTRIAERGARFWDSAEIRASTWYLVEGCSEDGTDFHRWVTTSIRRAAALQRELPTNSGTRIFAFVHATDAVKTAPIFEEVAAAYQFGSSSTYLLRFANGTSFSIVESDVQEMQPGPKEMRLVYASGSSHQTN